MVKTWSFLLSSFLMLVLSGCGLFNPPIQESNPQNPNLNLQVSSQNVTGQANTYVLVPVNLNSKMASPITYTKLILDYDPQVLEYAGVYAATADQDAQATPEASAGRLTLELFGTHKNGMNPDRVAFKLLGSQASSIQFHLLEAATLKGEHRIFAEKNGLNPQTQVAESRVNVGTGGLRQLPAANQDQDPSTTTRGFSPNLQVPAKLELAWAGVEMGDLNGDKTITKDDWEILLKALNGQLVLTPVQRYASDLHGDNQINAIDFAYLLAKQLNVQYGQGSTTSPLVVIHADTEVVPGNAALVLVGNPLTLAPINPKYTLGNTKNWILDSVASSVGASTSAFSSLTPIETAVGEKTTLQVRSSPALAYRVTTGTDRQIQTVGAPAGTAVSLSVIPGAVLFTASNQTKTLRIMAKDASGQPVSTAGLEIQWKVSDGSQLKLVANPDGTATVTSLVASGSAVVSAVSSRTPDLVSDPVLTTMVGLRTGVVTIPDSKIVYPFTNTSSTLQPGSSTNGIGGFTGAEIASYISVAADKTALAPAILRGVAPAVGSYVVASESAQMLGKVTQVVTRGNYSLMQLQLVQLPEIFSAYKVSFNSEALIAQGVLSTQSISKVSQVRTTRQSVAIGIPFPAGVNSNVCDVSGGFDLATFFLEPGRATITPILDASAEYDANGPKVSVIGGFKLSVQITAYLRVSPTLKGKISCTIVDLPEKSLPIPGPFAAVIGVYFKPKVGLDVSAQIEGIGGAQENLGYQFDYSGTKRWGFAVDQSGFRRLDPVDAPFTTSGSGPINRGTYQPSLSRFQVFGQIFGYIASDFGAKLFPVISPVSNVPFVPQVLLDQINKINQLTLLKFFTVKAGISGIITYGGIENTIFRRYPSNGAQLNAKLEFGFNVAPVNEFLKLITGKQDFAFDITAAATFGLISYYKGFSANEILANSITVSQPADAVTPIRIDPNVPFKIGRVLTKSAINSVPLELSATLAIPDVWDYSAQGVRLFITNAQREIQTEIPGNLNIDNSSKDTPVLSGEISFPSNICDTLKNVSGPRVTIVVFNKLFNFANSPNYVGDIPITCNQDGGLRLNPASLNLSATVNAAAGSNFEIQNVTVPGVPLDWKITAIPSWIEIRQVKSGTLAPGKSENVSIIALCPATPTTLKGVIVVRGSPNASTILQEKEETVELKCTNKQNPPPGGDPGGGWGDPHLVSFDGSTFDFQAAGEFIYAKSSVDPFQVQVRFTKGEYRVNYVSFNQSYALNVNGDRVGIYGSKLGGTTSFEILVNGNKQSFASDGSFYLELPKGGKISANLPVSGLTDSDFVDVRWSDGYGFTATGIQPYSPSSLNIWGRATVYIPIDKRGLIQGLLGNDNQNQQDDFTLRDGTQLVSPVATSDLYGKFGARGNGWRIDQTESLFDYDPGTNTDTFSDLNYPPKPFSVSDIPANDYASAEAICKAAGIIDPQTLVNCVVDYYLTGNIALVQVAKKVDPVAQSILISPPSLTLFAGSTYPFSIKLTGVTDPSVNWSATGGSVSPNGLYTAPSTPGTYQVTAQSVENGALIARANVTVVQRMQGAPAYQLAPGAFHLLIRRGNQVASTGENYYGQLGLGDFTNRNVLTLIPSISVQSIGTGIQESFGITASGQVFAWGHNDLGQLGVGDKINRNTPTLINFPVGVSIVSVVSEFNRNLANAALQVSVALSSSGQVYVWGTGAEGLGLGLTTITTYLNPVLIPTLTNIKKIAAYGGFYYAIDQSGQLYTWGDNFYNWLGTNVNDKQPITTPTRILKINGVTDIAVSTHKLAITESGQVYAWGANPSNQLGLGQGSSDVAEPTLISSLASIKAKAVTTGYSHSMVLADTGQVYAWGRNDRGQLGLGDIANRALPVLIPSLSNVIAIAAYGDSSYAITTDGQFYAWGYNGNGQFGNGSSVGTNTTPIRVTLPFPIEVQRVGTSTTR